MTSTRRLNNIISSFLGLLTTLFVLRDHKFKLI